MQKIIVKSLLLLILGLSSFSLTGCQTAKGFGKDMEKAGEEIQKGIDD